MSRLSPLQKERGARGRFRWIALGVVGAMVTPPLLLAHGNDIGLAKATLDGAHITIRYGRPKLNGRDPMKMIEPGEVWRMGADIPTTIESNAPLDFGGSKVPPGKHFLFVRWVEPGRWTLIVSSQPIAQYQPSTKLAEAPMTLERIHMPSEKVTVSFIRRGPGERLEVSWGTYRLACEFKRAM